MAELGCQANGYSVFGIGVDRKYALKWLFHQEKATFRGSQKVYVYSENVLSTHYQKSKTMALLHMRFAEAKGVSRYDFSGAAIFLKLLLRSKIYH
jgi:hypothetical protein